MKKLLGVAIASSLALGSFGTSAYSAGLACPDLSGSYRSPYDAPDSDTITTITYRQFGCDSLAITAIERGRRPFTQPRAYGVQTVSLKGLPAPTGANCLYNSYPGVCASYAVSADFITKTADKKNPMSMAAAMDPEHGSCMFSVSRFSKDVDENLVEQPQDANCDDGYQGVTAPIVFPKASN